MNAREQKMAEIGNRLDTLIKDVAWVKFCKARAASEANFTGSVEVAERRDRIKALLALAGPDASYVEDESEKRYLEMRHNDPTLSQSDKNIWEVARMAGV